MPKILKIFYLMPFAVLFAIGSLIQDLTPKWSPIYNHAATNPLEVIGQSVASSLVCSLTCGSLCAFCNHLVISTAEKLRVTKGWMLGILILVANVALAIFWMNFLSYFGLIEYRHGKPVPVTIMPYTIAIIGAGTILACKQIGNYRKPGGRQLWQNQG